MTNTTGVTDRIGKQFHLLVLGRLDVGIESHSYEEPRNWVHFANEG